MRNCVRNKRSGMTLIEVVIAITLMALLVTGMTLALRISLTSLGKANDKLTLTRRITGAQRILEQQIAGLMPVSAVTPVDAPCQGGVRIAFFQGESQTMRFASTYSLHEASRGKPRILEFQVVPGGESGGVRLVVNEIPYTSPFSAGEMVTWVGPVQTVDGGVCSQYFDNPVDVGPQSFVLGG